MSIVKTVFPESFGYDEAIAQMVDVHSRGVDIGWMKKRAAAGVFRNLDIKPEKDHSYVHLIAMGDSETWGQNRNGDIFFKQGKLVEIPVPKDGKSKNVKVDKGNKETHNTFVTHGKVYRNHVNRDPDKAEGEIYKSAHNDAMDRVELIVKLPNNKWQDDLEKIASGADTSWSMSCRVPYDTCSYCGNRAKNRSEYCEHAKDHMGEITKSGQQIGVINDHMCYFDISRVVVPADRIAFGLLKAASAQKVVSGAELSEQLGIVAPADWEDELMGPAIDKLAAIGKMADIEKEIEATGLGEGKGQTCIGREGLGFDEEVFPRELEDEDMRGLKCMKGEVPDMLGSLADAKICLSLKDFMRIVLGPRFEDVRDSVGEAEDLIPGIFGRMSKSPVSSLSGMDDLEFGNHIPPVAARMMIHKLAPKMSIDDEPMQKRITIMVLRGKKPMSLKSASYIHKPTSVISEKMALAYAMYKVAFCRRAGILNSDGEVVDKSLLSRAVLLGYKK
jgi:hypothetical protein